MAIPAAQIEQQVRAVDPFECTPESDKRKSVNGQGDPDPLATQSLVIAFLQQAQQAK